MKKTLVAAVAVMAGGLLLGQPASADGRGHGHGHWHGGPRASFGLYFGGPAYGPWYDPWYRPFPPSSYYEPRTVIIEREPAPQAQAQAPGANPIWYYCPNPAGYYPHVPRCNQQWVPVDPSTVPPR